MNTTKRRMKKRRTESAQFENDIAYGRAQFGRSRVRDKVVLGLVVDREPHGIRSRLERSEIKSAVQMDFNICPESGALNWVERVVIQSSWRPLAISAMG